MKLGILLATIVCELLLIGGVAWWLTRKKGRHNRAGEAEFALGGRQLPLLVVATTLALTVLGTPHIMGIFELSWHIGATAVWFGLAHVVLLAVVCLTTGIWARRLRLTTFAESLEAMYGPGVRIAVSCVMAGSIFGILTLETQGLGIVIAALTGMSVGDAAIIAGVLGILYVVFAGMKEVGWVNLFNAGIMYAGVVIATMYIATGLPGGDFSSVQLFHSPDGSPRMTSIFGAPDVMMDFGLALVFAMVLSMPINQVLLQTAMSAQDERTIVRALWVAAPLNGMFVVFTVVLGLTAKSLPKFSALGPKAAAPTMLVELLPPWVAVLLLVSFTGAILSSFAMTALSPSTIFANDIYKRLYRPDASEPEVRRVTQLTIVLLAVLAIASAAYLPPILAAVGWANGWLIPMFWIFIAGLFFRHSTRSAVVTLSVAWAVNSLWSMTDLPTWVGLPGLSNTYVLVVVTALTGIVTGKLWGDRPPYFKSPEYMRRVSGHGTGG